MRLTLRLSERGAEQNQTRVLETGRLTIGRGPDNDWVLLDPDRTLSKHHCRIDASEQAYMLTDLSTNGVFMAGSARPLGRGHSCALEHGDSFAIGPYRMLAEIEGQGYGQAMSNPPAEEEEVFEAPSTMSPIAPAIAAPWLSDIPTGGFGPDRRAAPMGWDAPPDPAAYAASGTLQARDPLDPRSGGEYPPMADRFSQEAEHIAAPSTVMRVPQAQIVLPADWNEADAPASAPGTESAPAWPPVLPSALHEEPDEPPGVALLPPDWIADESKPPRQAFGTPIAAASSSPIALNQAAPGVVASPLNPAATDWSPVPAAPVISQPPPLLNPVPTPIVTVREQAPQQPPASEPHATSNAGGAPSPSALVAAFLQGAGLPANTLADAEPEEAFREIGRMVRAAVDGVREILSTRALVKSEFRVEQTVLRRNDNNAMKFAPDAQRCLAAMVGAAPPGFLPGSAAMRQSMDDIKIHELALVAAINSVFADLSKQLDPETIMTRARQETGLTTMLPYAREVRCWAIYTETHALLQDSGAHNTGGSLLAPVAQAYARQLRRS